MVLEVVAFNTGSESSEIFLLCTPVREAVQKEGEYMLESS